MFRRLGIRGNLLLAFFGISAFAVIAGSFALYSFLEVGRVLRQISRHEAPEAILSLEISRQAERMVNAAPAMLTVATVAQLEQIRTSIKAEGERINEKILRLRSEYSGGQALETMDWTLKQLHGNVDELNELVIYRLQISHNRRALLNEFRDAYSKVVRLLSASITDLDSRIGRTRTADPAAGQGNGTAPTLVELLEARSALQAADEQASAVYGVFLEAQTTERTEDLSALSIRAQKAVGTLDALVESLDSSLAISLKPQLEKFHESIEGSGSIFARLEDEYSAKTKAREILIANSWLSEELSANVDELVDGTKKNITTAISEATSTQQLSTRVISAIVLLSIICSTLIVWLYVGRNLIARLTELSVCMESVAGGDLKIRLPSAERDDEIGRMTRALTVFRDTAVEIEENNLREIGQARQRLMDAIESISEGFCYFDSGDRLVVANNRYRALMYPGDENAVAEGMTFEELIRNAVHRGYVKISDAGVEAWVAERLARHRHPGAPHLQQRGSGRWIMVSERKTGDGGTVAIYSDITELKQREKELADKSRSMEDLSNQIAKYLSPQVYESIFTGKQEVTVASHRRKLSIFFSDIAGFTEMADQMESEDLTKLLNHYLTEMSQIALEHGATIDKYVGDAIVIFFGDPETRGTREDALACVKMAIAMRRKMKELQATWRDSGIAKPLECRIGINTGFCTVGNFGSEDRLDYTIIGTGVNLASRLESAASPGEILISYETYALVKDEILCDDMGRIQVKGIAYPVETYQVIDSYENLGREREVIREDFPNFSLEIDVEGLSADERSRAESALGRALNKLRYADKNAIKNAS